MAIQIGKYKRPGIFFEEIDISIITSPTVEGISNLVIGVSRKGPVNTAVLLKTQGDLERIFGSLDRQLERKGSFFHRTISKMLEASPVYAVNLLLTDDELDTIEYQAVSASAQYTNDIERTSPYRRFFDTTGFWKRDTGSFIDVTKDVSGYEKRVLNFTNLSDRFVTVFCFKSQKSGFDRSLLEWYGSIEKMPTYVYPTDLASDYLVDVLVVGGDWSNYSELAVDPRWSQYFNTEGLKKSKVRDFANDRNITLLSFYEGLSLIPYFRDLNGVNIFIETLINRDTDRTGLFCAFNNDLFETDYPKGIIDLIGNSMVGDNLSSNPPTNDETFYQSLDVNDGTKDGDIGIKFLSYDEKITETIPFSNRALDRPGNVIALFGTYSALKLNVFTHSFNDSSTVLGGVESGPNDDLNFSIPTYPNRTYWFTEGYVNDVRRSTTITTTTQSVNLQYLVDATSANGYAVIGGNLVSIVGTHSIELKASYYATSNATYSYNVAFVIDSQGSIKAAQTTATGSLPSVSASDIVLGYGTVSLYGGSFITGSSAFLQNSTITDLTVGTQTGGGPSAFKTLKAGTDFTIATSSSLSTGDIQVTFLNTNSTPSTDNYEVYRRFKLFNSMLTYVDSASTYKGLLLLDPQVGGTAGNIKKTLSTMTFSEIKTGTTVNKSFVMKTGLSNSEIANIVQKSELVFYKTDDEFIIDYAGFETKESIPVLDGTTASFGVVGKYSNFYTRYDQGLIDTGDLFYQNELYGSVQVEFMEGAGITASLDGYNFIVFRVNKTESYYDQNEAFFDAISDNLGDSSTGGYQMLIGGTLNSGAFTVKLDSGLVAGNGFTQPLGAGYVNPDGRAYILTNASGGAFTLDGGSTYSYYAFEVVESVVDETISVSKIYGYNSDYDDKPIYLEMYQEADTDLKVKFMDYQIAVGGTASQTLIGSIDPGVDTPLASNSTIYVKSQKSNYKQSVEVEYPAGWTEVKNKVLLDKNRYTEVKVGDYLECLFDPATVESDQMPKKLTRILSKKLWATNQNYVEITCDAPIKLYNFDGDKQTHRYTNIDDYVTTYKAISLKGFRIRQASLPDGTDSKQNDILDIVAKGTPLFKAITNKEAFDFRYLVDSFGLGLTEDSKQNLVDICGDRLDVFGIINMPSLKQFKNSSSPLFKDSDGTLQAEFISKGGDPESSPAFQYSFAKGAGVTTVGYFLPYVTVNDAGRPADVPPSAYVGLTYMRKHNSVITSIVPWTIAAGVTNGRITGIEDLEQIFTPSDIEWLNGAQMNPLTFKRNRGFIIETENTAQTIYRSALSYIHVREVLIELERELSIMLLGFQWKFNTPSVRAQIKLQADVICEKFVSKSGLYTYFNKVDEENNTQEIIDNQIGVLDTYVEPVKGMGIIVNNITILRTGSISSGGFINS